MLSVHKEILRTVLWSFRHYFLPFYKAKLLRLENNGMKDAAIKIIIKRSHDAANTLAGKQENNAISVT